MLLVLLVDSGVVVVAYSMVLVVVPVVLTVEIVLAVAKLW